MVTSDVEPCVGQHAFDLLLQHHRIFELVPGCQIEQRLGRSLAPQKERQPGSQFEIADVEYAVRSATFCRSGFRAIQELGTRENRRQTRLDARFEVSLRAASLKNASGAARSLSVTGRRKASFAMLERILAAHGSSSASVAGLQMKTRCRLTGSITVPAAVKGPDT